MGTFLRGGLDQPLDLNIKLDNNLNCLYIEKKNSDDK